MNSEEKLQHFREAVIGYARKTSGEELSDWRSGLEKEAEQHRKQKNLESLEKIRTESARVKADSNAAAAEKRVSLRRDLGEVEQTLTDRLFDEVRERIAVFRKSPDYLPYLVRLTGKIRKEAGNENALLLFRVAEQDRDLIPELAHRTGETFETAAMEFPGGVIGMAGENRLYDETFVSKLADLREGFSLLQLAEGESGSVEEKH